MLTLLGKIAVRQANAGKKNSRKKFSGYAVSREGILTAV